MYKAMDVYDALAALAACENVARAAAFLVATGEVAARDEVGDLVAFALAALGDQVAEVHEALEAGDPAR